MKLSDLLEKWTDTDARIRDAEVAEHVMGWKTYRTTNAGVVRMTPEMAADWGTGDSVEYKLDGTESGVTDVGHLNAYVPDYTTDASEDYAVLCHVREKSDADRFATFSYQLSLIFNARWDEEEVEDCDYETNAGFYVVGDYSKAALAALSTLTPHTTE